MFHVLLCLLMCFTIFDMKTNSSSPNWSFLCKLSERIHNVVLIVYVLKIIKRSLYLLYRYICRLLMVFYINMVTRCSLYNIRMSLSLASTAIIYQNGSIYATAIRFRETLTILAPISPPPLRMNYSPWQNGR